MGLCVQTVSESPVALSISALWMGDVGHNLLPPGDGGGGGEDGMVGAMVMSTLDMALVVRKHPRHSQKNRTPQTHLLSPRVADEDGPAHHHRHCQTGQAHSQQPGGIP